MKSKWPIGVFASIDAGLGVKLEVARELGVSTIQLHAPGEASRTPARARRVSGHAGRLGHFASRRSSAASREKATPTFPRSRGPSAWCRRPPARSARGR